MMIRRDVILCQTSAKMRERAEAETALTLSRLSVSYKTPTLVEAAGLYGICLHFLLLPPIAAPTLLVPPPGGRRSTRPAVRLVST